MHRSLTMLLLLFSAASIMADSGPGLIPAPQEPSVPPAQKVTAQAEPVLLHYAKAEEPAQGEKPAAPLPSGPAVPAPPPTPGLVLVPGAGVEPDLKTLDQLAARLRAQRERLNAERSDLAPDTGSTCATCSEDIMKTRLRLVELLTKIEVQRKQASLKRQEPPKPVPESPVVALPSRSAQAQDAEKSKPGPQMVKQENVPVKQQSIEPRRSSTVLVDKPEASHGSQDKSGPPLADLGKPIDPMGLAQALFQTGDYEGALSTYRVLDLKNLSKTDRAAVQYFMATCLRRLGKLDEAAALYREVVNAKEDEILADCAQWQLSAFRWRHDLETQLEQMRQRRRSVEVSP